METKTTIHKPLIHEHPLFYSAQFTIPDICTSCDAICNIYGGYFCNKPYCNVWLHKECAEAPLEIIHPLHPEHPIMLTNDKNPITTTKICYFCGCDLPRLCYSCSTCELKMHISCGMKQQPPAIEQPLCHDHPIIFKRDQYHYCEVCKEFIPGASYSCIECTMYFHVKCVQLSKEVKHPCHSNHPLNLITCDALTDGDEKTCNVCEYKTNKVYYHCLVCNFTTCLYCTRSPPPLVVEHIKTHQHPLTRLSKRISYICDVCGLERKKEKCHGSYICLQCDFVIHGKCIGFPLVISINLHVHRISFTRFLGAGYSECGVCHQSISQYHGAYSCSICPKYAVHLNCAINMKTVWDGVDLDEIPEDTEDITPYKVVGDELINHVSHVKHDLKLYKNNILYDHKWIQCEACMDPVGFDSIYVCEECCFVLHENCANLPMKKKYFFDVFPYMLEVDNIGDAITCRLCFTISDGFKYSWQGTKKVDVRCCSLSEPFVHAIHLHPLYFYNTSSVHEWLKCNACMEFLNTYVLYCDACNFYLCLFCATLPLKIQHRIDEHPLTLWCGENASGENWCDICEKKMDLSLWFYTCSGCGVSLHTRCVIGDFSRTNARTTIKFGAAEKIYEVVLNNQNNRPLCSQCHSLCISSVIIKKKDEDNVYLCSRSCLIDSEPMF